LEYQLHVERVLDLDQLLMKVVVLIEDVTVVFVVVVVVDE